LCDTGSNRVFAYDGALPPFFLQAARNFSRSLPCRPLASASAEHCFEIAVFSGVIALVAFLAGGVVVVVVVSAGWVVVVLVAAAKAPVAAEPTIAIETRMLAILIANSLDVPPGERTLSLAEAYARSGS
jgi:hypothetical protein